MKQLPEVKQFKRDLESYNFWKERVRKLDNLIQYCYDMLGGVHSPNLTDPPAFSPPDKEMEYKIRAEIEKHEEKKRKTQERIDETDAVLSRIPGEEREIVIEKFLHGALYSDLAVKYNYSHNTIKKKVNKAIEEALRGD